MYPIQLKGEGGSGILEFWLISDYINEESYKKKNENNKNAPDFKDSLDSMFSQTKLNDKLVINLSKNDLSQDNYVVKKIMLNNKGNLSLKILRILIDGNECESYGIKILNCNKKGLENIDTHKDELIILRSNEQIILDIQIKPDFNFYYMSKRIKFITVQKSIYLSINLHISSDFLAEKNGFTFKINNILNLSKSNVMYLIMTLLIIVYVSFVLISEEDNNDKKTIDYFDYKTLIKANSRLMFEYLYIKGYRKQNDNFHKKFFSDQIDRPGIVIDENLDLAIKEKRRFKAKRENNIYSLMRKSEEESNIIQENKNTTESFKENEMKINKTEEKANIINKDKQVKKTKEIKETKDINLIKKDKIIKKTAPLASEKMTKTEIPIIQYANKPVQSTTKVNTNTTKPATKINKKTENDNSLEALQNELNNKYAKKYAQNQNNSAAELTIISNKPVILDIQKDELMKVINNNTTPYIPKNIKKDDVDKNKILNNNDETNRSAIEKQELLNKSALSPKKEMIDNVTRSNNHKDEEENNFNYDDIHNLILDQINDKEIDERNSERRGEDEVNEEEIDNRVLTEKEDNEQENQFNSLKEKFAAFGKNNFIPITHAEEELDSEEEKENSSHYNSEAKQAPWESGAEEFAKQFNFNSIFGNNNNNNIKFTNYSLDNEMEESEVEKGPDDIYKSFSAFKTNSIYSGFGTFSLNPFSNDEGKQDDLLGDLRDDESDDKNVKSKDRLDDVIEDEDEEEDPDWADEDMTHKKDGFFDETGAFKLKQTDFNFDMDKRFKLK